MDALYLDYPFHTDGRGRTAETDEDDHIRDLIQVRLELRRCSDHTDPVLSLELQLAKDLVHVEPPAFIIQRPRGRHWRCGTRPRPPEAAVDEVEGA